MVLSKEKELLLKNLTVKRKFYFENVEKIKKGVEDNDVFMSWSLEGIQERVKKLNHASTRLEEIHLDWVCEEFERPENWDTENDEVDTLIMELTSKLLTRVRELNKEEQSSVSNETLNQSIANSIAHAAPLKVEVQQTDAMGNIPNVWGTFDGDYAKWRMFRDRFKASVHDNNKLQTIVKFQNLKTACVGEAEGALGEWDLTEENYPKAWERLQAIYENDYMQIQAFMKKLRNLPNMSSSSSKAIREVIDTVHKHIHGLKRYIKLEEGYPYVVFAVIDRMDKETYRAWEKHRSALVRNKERSQTAPVASGSRQTEQNLNDEGEICVTSKHVPTWKELEEFLEREASIRVHAENRDDVEEPKTKNQKRQKQFNKRFVQKKKNVPDFLQCVLCDGVHPVWKCPIFKSMNLAGRKNHVSQNDLCERCLRKSHEGRCAKEECNRPCPRCKPTVYHNSAVCPNAELDAKMAMLAHENRNQNRGRKRGHPNKTWNKHAKKKRFEDEKDEKQDRMQSGVNKIGEWSVMNGNTNAIKIPNNRANGKREFTVLLATINMKLQINANTNAICRAIADTGATLSCITSRFVDLNAFATKKCQRVILGVSGAERIKRKIITTITPWFESDYALQAEFFVLNRLDGLYPCSQIQVSKEQIKHLCLADEYFDTPAPIDAILSADIYANIIGTDLYKHTDGAIMQSSSLGHIILGKFEIKKKFESDLPILNIMHCNENPDDVIEKALNKFWEIENINKCENEMSLSEEQKAVEDFFVKTYYREKNGRYVVKMPMKPNCNDLGDSRAIALKQFLQTERKLQKNPELKGKYVQFMRDYQALGYMQPAERAPSSNLIFYLPHHAILKKYRIVFNASTKAFMGISLNRMQLIGAKLQYDLQLQIMRFRRHKIGVATDISKMFNKIGLNPEQWNLQRVFWRESPDDELKEYVLTVVTFGVASSAHSSVRVLQQNARDYAEQFPKASETIEKCFYMDDGIFGTVTVEEAKILCKEIEFVLNQGNFTLKNWASNSKELERYMNANTANEIDMAEDEEMKILGLRWLKNTDEFTISVKPIEMRKKITKRNILSDITKLYDPNGFISPVIVKAKTIMQDIWRLKSVDWDDEVPEDIKNEWLQLYNSLPLLTEFKIKRWLEITPECKIQIHAFCDACIRAYGAAIYVRVVDAFDNIHCTLLSAKSRIAPKKDQLTIPRLELMGMLVLSEQLEAVLQACDFQTDDVTIWSDSSVVLHWMKKQPHELKAFVANRVKLIQEKTKNFKKKHVISGDNPADLVSRGMKIQDFIKSKFWIEGPNWLKQDESKWPQPKLVITPEEKQEILKECKPTVSVERVNKICSGSDNTLIYNRFNDWNKIINVTAFVLRMRRIYKKDKSIKGKKYPTVEERNDALEYWIKFEQQKAFMKEINCMKAKDKLPSKSDIASLTPVMDVKGLLRVGGRIDKACVAYDKKHQYIVPSKSRLSYLLIKYAHDETMHGGAQMMMQFLRSRFWIPKMRSEIKRYIHTCVECVRQAHASARQIMAELPEVRVKPASPFENVGVDMAGPYIMRATSKLNTNTRGRNLPDVKGWIAVFVCMVTRAVHLEPTEGMSTDDFLAAYQRFVSRRGDPKNIFSDKGTNFVGTDNELKRAKQAWDDEKIHHFVHISGTKWHYISPSAPHEGGIWEAAVKSMKHHLKRVMGTQKYSFQGVATLTASVEACLNSRPLCALSDDPNDLQALTPGHFLIGRPLRLPLHESVDSPPYNARRLFLEMKFQIEAFWKQFANDYLHSLMQRPKWREEQENLKIGQLVLIKSDNVKPSYWAMARIIRTNMGSDGKVRSVLLKTQLGELERSIRQLCVLPSDLELSYWK